MSSRRGLASEGNRSRSAFDDGGGVVDGQRGLRDERQLLRIANLELRGLLDVLDEMHAAAVAGVETAHGAFDFRMAGVADEHHVAPFARITRDFHVHLGDQRTGGVEHREAAARGFVLDRGGHAMRGKDDRGAVGHLVELVDEHRAELAQALDHVHVVHHLVAHVDRRAEQVDGALDDVDGAIDAGAETPGIGEQDLHARVACAGLPGAHRGSPARRRW